VSPPDIDVTELELEDAIWRVAKLLVAETASMRENNRP